MPWYVKPTEYVCDDCGTHYNNRPSKQPKVGTYANSSAKVSGPTLAITRCEGCTAQRQRHFAGGTENQGVRFGTTITYRIHNGGNFSFLGSPTPMASMAGASEPAMSASGALNRMAHPAYPGGMIRPPGSFSGPNLGHAALAAWPGQPGMMRHHVHVGGGGQQRVLFGWTARAYPAPNQNWVQAITLYIGS